MVNHVYIRVDGNEVIATGHVMRCLSIAKKIREKGSEVTFITADNRPGELIRNCGFSVDVLDTVWNALDEETSKICDYILKHHVKVLLMDSYFVTATYLQQISQYTRIIYIDDLCCFAYPVNMLINYDAFIDKGIYDNLYQSADVLPYIITGSKYVPLRDEFAGQTFKVRPKVTKILITTGGTDRLNVAGNLLKMFFTITELRKLEYHVIVGCFNENKDELYLLAESHNNIYLHENVNNMAEWMETCDVAISAAGTTVYELCACGIPSICLEVADNQKGIRIWGKKGYILYAGNAYEDINKCMKRCIKALLFYINNYEERKRKSINMQSLVDGYGAERIAEYVINELHDYKEGMDRNA